MAENIENNGCSQRDNAEHEGYAKARRSFNLIWKERLINSGFYDLATAYQSVHVNY